MSSNNNPSAKQQYPDERFIFTFSLFFSFFYISFFLSFYLLEITTVPHCTPHNSFGDERRHKQHSTHSTPHFNTQHARLFTVHASPRSSSRRTRRRQRRRIAQMHFVCVCLSHSLSLNARFYLFICSSLAGAYVVVVCMLCDVLLLYLMMNRELFLSVRVYF